MSERERTSEQLSAYLDGELSPDETKRIEQRLETEPDLAAELTELKRVREMVRSLPRETLGADFAGRVLAQAERAHLVGGAGRAASGGGIHWARYMASAAVLLVVIGLAAIAFVTLYVPQQAGDAPTLAHAERKEGQDLESAAKDEVAVAAVAEPAPTLTRTSDVSGRADMLDSAEAHMVGQLLASQNLPAETADVAVVRETIHTSDLAVAQRQVELFLADNSVQYASTTGPGDSWAGKARSESSISTPRLANVYDLRQAGPEKVQFVVLLSPSQVPEFQGQIRQAQVGPSLDFADRGAATPARLPLAKDTFSDEAGQVARKAPERPRLAEEARPTRGYARRGRSVDDEEEHMAFRGRAAGEEEDKDRSFGTGATVADNSSFAPSAGIPVKSLPLSLPEDGAVTALLITLSRAPVPAAEAVSAPAATMPEPASTQPAEAD